MHRLLTIEEAATTLGVPVGSLLTAARRHGFLVKMGRALRIDPNDIPELIEQCRDKPKAPGYIAEKTAAVTTSSGTPDAGRSQRAQETAEKLKRFSPDISRRKTDR